MTVEPNGRASSARAREMAEAEAPAKAAEGSAVAPSASSSISAPVTSACDAAAAPAAGLGKRPRDSWFGTAGDGGAQSSAMSSKLQALETGAKVSSIKSKLSKPKPGASAGGSGESARKTGLTRDELLENQARHRAKMESKGKPVPYYRKN